MSEALDGKNSFLQIHFQEPTIDQNNPWDDDRLNRKSFADHLTQIVSVQSNPCVITINGEWGSGKSFLLKRWQCDLRKGNFATLYFNAWEADSVDNAALSLLGELYGFLKGKGDGYIREQVASLSESFSKLLKISNISRVIAKKVEENSGIDITSATTHCLDAYADSVEERKTLRKTLAEISTAVHASHGKPFVFIVDELDRCRPLFAIEILEATKHIFNVPNCIFVLGIDRSQLEHSIRSVYGDIDAAKYLERFFDFEMKLSCPEVEVYFNHLYRTYIPNNSNGPEYLTPGNKDGKFRLALLHICQYFSLNLRELEIVFKTYIAVSCFLEIHLCKFPILLAIMIVVRLKEPEKYVLFVKSVCNPKEILDLPYISESPTNECLGLVMATLYGSYMDSQKQSPFDDEIKALLNSNLWDPHNPKADKAVPQQIIPRYVAEGLTYRAKALDNRRPLQHDFNPAFFFISPFNNNETPQMRDKLDLAKILDMIA